MCIAIWKPKDMLLTQDTLNECWRINDDGAGFMFAEKGKLTIKKGYFTLDKFMEAYDEHKQKALAIHFRIKTHGNIDVENCHPYSVDSNLAFIHNGIIQDVGSNEDLNMSDTWHFNEKYLKPLRKKHAGFFKDPVAKKLIEKFIGYSKLIFMNSKGEVEVFNEQSGNWNSNCWFSNTSWKTYKAPPKQTHPTYYGESYYDSDFDYQGPRWKKKTTDLVPTKTNDTFKQGDTCFLIMDDGQFQSGEYCVIDYIIPGNRAGVHDAQFPNFKATVSLFSIQKTAIITPLPIHFLEQNKEKEIEVLKPETFDFKIGSEAIFTGNWNHFRYGEEVKISTVMQEHILGTCCDTNKTYKIPKAKLEPVEKALYFLDREMEKNAPL